MKVCACPGLAVDSYYQSSMICFVMMATPEIKVALYSIMLILVIIDCGLLMDVHT